MIVVDLGNTNIVIGFFDKSKLKKILRFETKKFKFNKILILNIQKELKKYKFNKNYQLIILGSVVPRKNIEIKKIATNINWKIIDIKGSNIILPLKIKFYPHNHIGADRIANSVAAINYYSKNCIIVDFGTATTFDIIKNETYIGGVITPGIELSNIILGQYAAKLKKIKIKKIKNIIGRNTLEAMQSGFYWGYTALIEGILKKIITKERNYKPVIIFTGGLASTYSNELNYKIIEDDKLTLRGLYHIGLSNVKS
ncbi:MAG: hypothetical protein CMI95_02215 [Pelagibacteraceae bacterium]|nr:hypothetical protein [Pelagibacteraceae bacterium]|tara:strand:+ start:14807 stop:15571 length:765 start_codon:yes stop_codon:yes gene_type:complete